MYRRALAIALKALGEEHPETATSYSNLAMTSETGEICRGRGDGPPGPGDLPGGPRRGHPDTASCYNNLAVALSDQGKYAEAEAMYRRALAIHLKALGEGHPEIVMSYNNLAETLRDQGKRAEAEAMHRRALAIA